MGRIVVIDELTGHEFRFQVETGNGVQVLDAFAPRWADGKEPSSTTKYVIEARYFADREAVARGWITP